MRNIVAIFIAFAAFFVPAIYDIFCLKKIRHSFFSLAVLVYLIMLSLFNDNTEGGSLAKFVYGLSAVLILYVYSFICLFRIIFFLYKKMIKNHQ